MFMSSIKSYYHRNCCAWVSLKNVEKMFFKVFPQEVISLACSALFFHLILFSKSGELKEMTPLQSDKDEHIRMYIRDPLHSGNECTHSLCASSYACISAHMHVQHHTQWRNHSSQTKGFPDYHKKRLMPAHASLVWGENYEATRD